MEHGSIQSLDGGLQPVEPLEELGGGRLALGRRLGRCRLGHRGAAEQRVGEGADTSTEDDQYAGREHR